MQENKEMTSKQKKEMQKAEFHQKFGRYWLIYMTLGFTAILSFIGGLMLPFMKPDVIVPLSWGTAGAGIFYALGFLLIGEGAANFWFDKVTDQDPDNREQKIIAGLMIAASVIVSLSTALATSYIIAYWVGVFDTFLSIPAWAQKYIAISIPFMLIAHATAGIIFKSVSDEAFAEREAKSRIAQARNEAAEMRARARANWIIENAPKIAREMGEMEAKEELDALKAKIREKQIKRGVQYVSETQDVRQFSDNGKSKEKDFSNRQS